MKVIRTMPLLLALLAAGTAIAADRAFVLLTPDKNAPVEEARVAPDSAFATALRYGLDPAVSRISVQLLVDEYERLQWSVGYVDWSAARGTSGFSIDARTGAVIGRMVTRGAHDKSRYEYETDPGEVGVDRTPPPAPEVRFMRASRGYYPKRACLLRVEVQSAQKGVIEAYFQHLSDDRTPRGEMGFVLEQIGGTRPLPDNWGPQVPCYAQIKYHPDSLVVFINWDDGSDEHHQPVSTRFAVYAIDKGGNRSVAPDTLVVELPGS